MQLLLGSGGFRTDEMREPWFAAVDQHLRGAKTVTFLPYALADHDGYVEWMQDWHAGRDVVGLHSAADPVEALRAAESISVGGGNSYRLTKTLHDQGLLDVMRERVRAGVPFIGVSAGTNVACPTMRTTNDMPIVEPPSFETLGLVPFQINPHYHGGSIWVERGGALHEHGGETRDDRIAEFHEENQTPVVGLSEGAWLAVDEKRVLLEGGRARVFRRGQDPEDHEPGSILDLA